MSKAFTRESDDAPEQPLVRPAATGVTNYLTASGARLLKEELEKLISLGNSAAVTVEVRQRILQIQKSLAAAVVIEPPATPWDEVLFGATVTVREGDGTEAKYRLVGPEEIDLDKNWVSSTSPIARAMLKGRVGQKIKFRIPAGEQNWEITGIVYE